MSEIERSNSPGMIALFTIFQFVFDNDWFHGVP